MVSVKKGHPDWVSLHLFISLVCLVFICLPAACGTSWTGGCSSGSSVPRRGVPRRVVQFKTQNLKLSSLWSDEMTGKPHEIVQHFFKCLSVVLVYVVIREISGKNEPCFLLFPPENPQFKIQHSKFNILNLLYFLHFRN